jgi:ATP/maltotriose-dependent transcriptional regulator MalT
MQRQSLPAAKPCIPPIRPEPVSHPRLREQLNAGLAMRGGVLRALTLVCAPAGFGKSMLLSEWVHAVANGPVGFPTGPLSRPSGCSNP